MYICAHAEIHAYIEGRQAAIQHTTASRHLGSPERGPSRLDRPELRLRSARAPSIFAGGRAGDV
eukprot:8361748-Heterocapsa_arctica.AAC.1